MKSNQQRGKYLSCSLSTKVVKTPKADPASYRGIYLSSALAKLFERILNSRLTKFTQTHSTLTENQLGTRPGRQNPRCNLRPALHHPIQHITEGSCNLRCLL